MRQGNEAWGWSGWFPFFFFTRGTLRRLATRTTSTTTLQGQKGQVFQYVFGTLPMRVTAYYLSRKSGTRCETVQTHGQLSDHALKTVIVQAQRVNLGLHVLEIIDRDIFLGFNRCRCSSSERRRRWRDWYILIRAWVEAEELVGVHRKGSWGAMAVGAAVVGSSVLDRMRSYSVRECPTVRCGSRVTHRRRIRCRECPRERLARRRRGLRCQRQRPSMSLTVDAADASSVLRLLLMHRDRRIRHLCRTAIHSRIHDRMGIAGSSRSWPNGLFVMYACPLDNLFGWPLDPVAIFVVLNFVIVVLVIFLLALVCIPARIARQLKCQSPDLLFNAKTDTRPRNQSRKKHEIIRTVFFMQN